MKKIIATILTLAILIATTTAYASNTTAETAETPTETAVHPAPALAWEPMCEGDFYATLTYEEDGVTFIDFNDGSWAVINRNRNPIEYTFQPAPMGDFAYTFSEHEYDDPYILFWGAMRTYQECMYGVDREAVIDGDGFNIMTFIFTDSEIEGYKEYMTMWKEMTESE